MMHVRFNIHCYKTKIYIVNFSMVVLSGRLDVKIKMFDVYEDNNEFRSFVINFFQHLNSFSGRLVLASFSFVQTVSVSNVRTLAKIS